MARPTSFLDDVVNQAMGGGRVAKVGKLQRKKISSREFSDRYRHYEPPLPTPKFHDIWYQAIDDAIASPNDEKIFILAAREHAKTSVVTTTIARYLANNRKGRVGIICSNDILATARLREVKGILDDPAVVADYGVFRPTGRGAKWDSHEIIIEGSALALGKDVSIFASGSGSRITGSHCDLLIFDDIETIESVNTPESRQKTKRWFATEALNVLSPGGTAIVLGTRKHFDDLYSVLLDPASGFVSLDQHKRCWKVDPETEDEIIKNGRPIPIWPEKWSYESLMARKATLDQMDATSWSQEFLNLPLSSETQMFHPQFWPTYEEVPPNSVRVIAVDLAVRQKQKNDRSAIMVGSLHIDTNDFYLEYASRGRWGFNETLDEIDRVAREFPPFVIGIENHQYQLAAVEEFARRTTWAVEGLDADMDKIARAKLFEARAGLGKVYRPEGNPGWWHLLFEEASTFPAGSHDDLVDAASYLCLMLAKLERREQTVAPRFIARTTAVGPDHRASWYDSP